MYTSLDEDYSKNKDTHSKLLDKKCMALALLVVSSFIFFLFQPISLQAADLTIEGYVLTNKTRVGRTQYNYSFTAQLTNNADVLCNVQSTLTSSDDNIIIIDSELNFGHVMQGNTVTSQDTFTIQVDRLEDFYEENLSWEFTYDEPTLQSLTITPTSLTFTEAGNTQNVNVTGTFLCGSPRDLTSGSTGTIYHSSDSGIVTVDTNGLVSAVSYGIAHITISHGQVSETIEVTVSIPPTIETFSPSPGSTFNQSPITISGTVDQDGVQVMVNGQSATVNNRSFSAAAISLIEGENTITIIAENSLGLTDTETFSVMVLDITPPTITISSPQEDSEVSDPHISIIGEINDAHLISFLRINSTSVPFHENRFNHLITLSEGENTITLTASDEFGHETTKHIKITYTKIDNEPPELTISTPYEGDIFSSSPIQVMGSVKDESPVEITVNDVSLSITDEGFNSFSAAIGLNEGQNNIIIEATDSHDNTSSLSLNVFLDTAPPTIHNISTPSSPTNTDRVMMTGNTESGARIKITGGAEVFSATASELGNFEVSVFLKENAENRLKIHAQDKAGHKSAEHLLTVIHDSEPPQISITTPAVGTILPSKSITVTGKVKDISSIFLILIRVNGQIVNEQGVSLSQDDQFSQSLELPEGENTITIEAKDEANNQNIASIPVTVEIPSDDIDPPLITIISPQAGSYHNQAPIQIKGSVIDAHPISYIHINGVPLDLAADLSGNIFTGSLYLQENTETIATIEASDESGHKATTTIRVFHDTIPPEKPIVEDLPEVTKLTKLSISGQAEAGSNVIIGIGQQEVVALADGLGVFGRIIELNRNIMNNLSLICRDQAGNEGEAAYFQIRQDSLAPQVSSLSPVDGQTGVDLEIPVYITFSEAIDCASVPGNVLLMANGSSLSSSFSCVDDGARLIFDDDQISQLPPNTQFELRLNPGLTDMAGNELGETYRSFFTTKDTQAPDPPVVTPDLPEATKFRHVVAAGKAEAKAQVIITGASNDLEVMADDKGNFSAQVVLTPNTTNNLSLVARDTSGNVSESIQHSIRHDDLPPLITITPANGAVDVSCQEGYIDLHFSEPIKINTLISRISLYQNDQHISANLMWDSSFTSARYIPDSSLLPQKTYIVKVSSGLSDQCGNQTAADTICSFSTEDTIPPPAPVITSYPSSTKETQATISGETEAGCKVLVSGGAHGNIPLEITVNNEGQFSLIINLILDSLNHISFVSEDASENKSKAVQVSIKQDSTAPQIVRVLPDGTRKVRYDTNVLVTFSEEVLPDTINSNFSLLDPEGQNIEGIVVISQGGRVATFNAAHPLQQEKTYTIHLNAGLSDILGNFTTSAFTSTFTTLQDTTFPKEPVITSLNPPSPTQELTVTITGNTTSYCQVEVTGGAQPVQTAANEKGEFTLNEVSLLENQTNTLVISATNPVNNLSSSISVKIVQDNTAPIVTISAPPTGITLSKNMVTIIGSVEDVSGVEQVLIINGEKSFEANLNKNSFVGAIELFEGANTIEVSATDRVGQIGSSSIQIERIIEAEGVDTTTPVIAITYPNDGATTFDDKVYVEGTVEDNDPAIMGSLTINGKSPDSWVFNVFAALVDLEANENIITATATDSAGNTGTCTIIVYADTQEAPIPQLSDLPEFTDLLVIMVNGTTQAGMEILIEGGKGDIYLQADETGVFSAGVVLHPNQTNHLKVYAIAESGKKSLPAEVSIDQDSEEPSVVSLIPQDGENMVDSSTNIVVTFSEAIDSNSITLNTFVVSGPEEEISGSFTFTPQGTMVTFTPSESLPLSQTISVRLTADIKDVHGYTMSTDYLSSFQVQDTPTTVSGIVVNPDLVPVEGVTIAIADTELSDTTDVNGLFTINNPPLGEQNLLVDGATAISSQQFTSLSFTLLIEAGQDNTLGRPLFLTPVDQGSMTSIDPTQDQNLNFNGRIPGFSLEVKANSITLPDGKANGVITATEVDINNLPARLPDNSLPTMLVNLEPSGTRIDPSCNVTFPNKMNLPVGSEVAIFGFEGGMQEYQVIGTGIVAEQSVDIPTAGIMRNRRICSSADWDEVIGLIESAAVPSIIRSKEPCVNGFSFYGYFPIETAETDIISTKDAYLVGRVVDVLGNSIPNVKVDVAASDTRSTTDENGYYKIPLPERAVFTLKVFALIPTAVADKSGQAQYAVFASEAISVGTEQITEVPDIIVDCLYIGGDIQYIDSFGKRVLPGDTTHFLDGELISVSSEIASEVEIRAYREEYPGVFSKDPMFTLKADQEPLDAFKHCRFSQQIFLGKGDNQTGALLLPGDLIRLVGFDKATGYLGFRDFRIPTVVEDIDFEADFSLYAPQVKSRMERVFYNDLDMQRQSIPNNGIALITDQFIYLNTNWSIQEETLPEVPIVKLYGRLLVSTSGSEQDIRFEVPAGEYTRIIDLRDIYPNRKLALDIESDIGFEVLTISGANNFDKDHMLYMDLGASKDPSQEYKINIFNIKLISQNDEENVTSAEGEIFPHGQLEIKDIESGQIYTFEADEKGQFKGEIPLTGEQGFENIVYDLQGKATAPFSLDAVAYPMVKGLSNLFGDSIGDPNIIAEAVGDSDIVVGTVGDIIVITGQNFSEDPRDNIVRINGQRAEVIDTSPNSLSVVVPEDASTGPLTVKVAGKTSNDDFEFYFISDGLPHGGFESGDFRGFIHEGEARVVESICKMKASQGEYMAGLSTSQDPLYGVTTLATNLFFVPEGMKTLTLDFDIMATGFAGNLGSLLSVRLQVPRQDDKFILPHPSQTVSFIGGPISGYEINTLFQTISLDVSDLAGTRIPAKLVIQTKGIAEGAVPGPGLIADDDSPMGGDKLRGSGLLIDNLRLTESEIVIIPSPVIEKITAYSLGEGVGQIFGESGAVMAGGTVIAINLVSGEEYSVNADNDGGFTLDVGHVTEGKSYYGLQVKDGEGNRSVAVMVVIGENE